MNRQQIIIDIKIKDCQLELIKIMSELQDCTIECYRCEHDLLRTNMNVIKIENTLVKQFNRSFKN